MNDIQNTSFVAGQAQSYVDAYAPPTATPPTALVEETQDQQQPGGSFVNSPLTNSAQPIPSQDYSQKDYSQTSEQPSEKLEEQNIFTMLGVSNGTEEQKEAFLDELQQVIWEDFLENDVELLISSADYAKMQQLLQEQHSSDLEQQEKVVVFLEKLIPDLEEIMLEKALALKGDMLRERIAGMKEFFAGRESELAKIAEAEALVQQNRWGSASALLNTLQS